MPPRFTMPGKPSGDRNPQFPAQFPLPVDLFDERNRIPLPKELMQLLADATTPEPSLAVIFITQMLHSCELPMKYWADWFARIHDWEVMLPAVMHTCYMATDDVDVATSASWVGICARVAVAAAPQTFQLRAAECPMTGDLAKHWIFGAMRGLAHVVDKSAPLPTWYLPPWPFVRTNLLRDRDAQCGETQHKHVPGCISLYPGTWSIAFYMEHGREPTAADAAMTFQHNPQAN